MSLSAATGGGGGGGSVVRRGAAFVGLSVFLSRNLVAPEAFDVVHDALRFGGATVALCADPSRNGPEDFHVISSQDHEKFADLRAKGCNLVGPQCILSCAKEHRTLPKQGYTCCLAMEGVKVLCSSFEKDQKVKIEQMVTAMGGVLQTRVSMEVNFVIVTSVLATKYKWASRKLNKPIVTIDWLKQCWKEHRIVPPESYQIPPFTGLTICVTRIPADERKEIEQKIKKNGGVYSADLTRMCTHLVSNAPEGDKYKVAQTWGNIQIVDRRWIDHSIARRVCLEESVYSVRKNNYISTEAKNLQKEQNCLENSSASLQPFIEDLDSTLSQNVSTSYSEAVKVSTSVDNGPTTKKTDELKDEYRVAEDSEEDNDLYLSNCRIHLAGFEGNEMRKYVTMIRQGGGSRHIVLSERLTHIVVGAPSEHQKKEIRQLATWGVMYVVKAAWLEECNRTKLEIPVASLHVAFELLCSKESSCVNIGQCGDTQGTKAIKGLQNTPGILTVHPLPENQREYEPSVLGKRTKGTASSDISCNRVSSNVMELEKSTQNGTLGHIGGIGIRVTDASSLLGLQISKASSTFKGKTFCFSNSFPHDRRDQVTEWIREGGGILLECGKPNLDFMIECHGINKVSSVISCATVVSTHWVRSCLEEGSLQDVQSHVLYSPLQCRIPLPGFDGFRICVSQYADRERLLLKNLCFTLGAKFTERLTKKVTHLLCKFANGPKYEACCKKGIPAITAEWVFQCVSQDTVASLDQFLPQPVTSQDWEAGLCPLSQYYTEAASVLSSHAQSQLFSESQVPMCNSLNEISGNVNDETTAGSKLSTGICKRTKLAGNEMSQHSAAQKEGPVANCKTDPDVADAIEDLLAHSTKIQDLQYPSRANSDPTIFEAGHPVVAQELENSHSGFGITRHWLNQPQKQDCAPEPASYNRNTCTFDAFSETQSDCLMVGYEEDLSGRQKIIDRVRSQNTSELPSTS